jgi:hypothetical protein
MVLTVAHTLFTKQRYEDRTTQERDEHADMPSVGVMAHIFSRLECQRQESTGVSMKLEATSWLLFFTGFRPFFQILTSSDDFSPGSSISGASKDIKRIQKVTT